MTIGTSIESSFSGRPDGLSLRSTRVAGPVYPETVISPEKGTSLVVIQSSPVFMVP